MGPAKQQAVYLQRPRNTVHLQYWAGDMQCPIFDWLHFGLLQAQAEGMLYCQRRRWQHSRGLTFATPLACLRAELSKHAQHVDL